MRFKSILLAILLATAVFGQKYQPTPENLKAREWFQDAKFGLFIHWGLYAVPGFERRISPTTGPLVLQMYWTVVMEIIEEIIRRTGDVPYVFPNVAQKNRMERMLRFHRMSIDRGY